MLLHFPPPLSVIVFKRLKCNNKVIFDVFTCFALLFKIYFEGFFFLVKIILNVFSGAKLEIITFLNNLGF